MVSVKKLAAKLAAADMPAVAVTDLNNLFGGFDFSQSSVGAGLQPIIGTEVSFYNPWVGTDDNMVLLCQNNDGYINLSKIISYFHLESDSGANLLKLIEEKSSGLICLWGGGRGALPTIVASKTPSELVGDTITNFKRIFGDRFYVELQRCGEAWERRSEPLLIRGAYDLDIPLVATNDVYYLNPEDAYYQDILQCVGRGEFETQDDRFRSTGEHYLKSAVQMHELFHDIPEAVENTVEVARRCAYFVKKRDPILPVYPLGEGKTADDELLEQARAGFEVRFRSVVERLGQVEAEKIRSKYETRFDFEFQTIKGMGFSGYFLIVSDFMIWAKEQRIPIGVRGSGATSVIAWCMNITHLDPIRFGLVFERFLNPERVSLPDFDVDFCQKRRSEVIDYVRNKYGKDSVAQIITFGKLQAKAAVRDVGRVIQVPFPLVDKLAKLIGEAKNLKEALSLEPNLSALLESDALARRCFEIAEKVEGQYRHASTHAAGVIIADRPLVEYVPLYKDPSSDMPVTQFQYKDAESAGLVKFDFLGLRTLTILATAVELVRQRTGNYIEILDLDFADKKVFDMLSAADSTGVFQLESAGMRDLLIGLKPSKIEHLIALISLYRPGPMDSIPTYIRRANGEEEVEYDHEMLAPVLEETYGVITYQEDVMQIARDLGGYTLGEADLLRRAMGKKVASEMEVHEKKFCDGAEAHGIPRKTSKIIFDKCAKFAGYGFNKGHAAAYSQVSYQTAYLKCRFPIEFYCACMTVDIESIDRLKLYVKEVQATGIPLLPPCVNQSESEFSIQKTQNSDEKSGIRYGLAALKNVGTTAAEAIASERRRGGLFRDVSDFFTRVSVASVSKAVIMQLVRAGALDGLSRNRGALLENLDNLYDIGKALSRANASDQGGLFAPTVGIKMEDIDTFKARPFLDDLQDELLSVGFYFSGHPLDAFPQKQTGNRLSIKAFKKTVKERGEATVAVRCLVQAVQIRKSKRNGNKYAFLTLSDQGDDVEAMSFSDDTGEIVGASSEGKLCVAVVSGESDETRVRYTLRSISPLMDENKPLDDVVVFLTRERLKDPRFIEEMKVELIGMGRGKTKVCIEVDTANGRIVRIELPDRYDVNATKIQQSVYVSMGIH